MGESELYVHAKYSDQMSVNFGVHQFQTTVTVAPATSGHKVKYRMKYYTIYDRKPALYGLRDVHILAGCTASRTDCYYTLSQCQEAV